MNLNQKPLNRKKGSSSVLIVMIMLFLVTLGVLILISSRSNFLLSKKNASWIKEYYALESLASEHKHEIRRMIKSTPHLNFENLLEIEMENFLIDFEKSKAHEDGTWTLAYVSIHPQNSRKFYTELKIVIENKGFKVYKMAWTEKPTVFEYEDDIEFQDIGG